MLRSPTLRLRGWPRRLHGCSNTNSIPPLLHLSKTSRKDDRRLGRRTSKASMLRRWAPAYWTNSLRPLHRRRCPSQNPSHPRPQEDLKSSTSDTRVKTGSTPRTVTRGRDSLPPRCTIPNKDGPPLSTRPDNSTSGLEEAGRAPATGEMTTAGGIGPDGHPVTGDTEDEESLEDATTVEVIRVDTAEVMEEMDTRQGVRAQEGMDQEDMEVPEGLEVQEDLVDLGVRETPTAPEVPAGPTDTIQRMEMLTRPWDAKVGLDAGDRPHSKVSGNLLLPRTIALPRGLDFPDVPTLIGRDPLYPPPLLHLTRDQPRLLPPSTRAPT